MDTNKRSILIVIGTIALMALLCVTTFCFLAYEQIKIPPELNTVTAGLLGSLASMLVKTSPTTTTPPDTTPTNPTT